MLSLGRNSPYIWTGWCFTFPQPPHFIKIFLFNWTFSSNFPMTSEVLSNAIILWFFRNFPRNFCMNRSHLTGRVFHWKSWRWSFPRFPSSCHCPVLHRSFRSQSLQEASRRRTFRVDKGITPAKLVHPRRRTRECRQYIFHCGYTTLLRTGLDRFQFGEFLPTFYDPEYSWKIPMIGVVWKCIYAQFSLSRLSRNWLYTCGLAAQKSCGSTAKWRQKKEPSWWSYVAWNWELFRLNPLFFFNDYTAEIVEIKRKISSWSIFRCN